MELIVKKVIIIQIEKVIKMAGQKQGKVEIVAVELAKTLGGFVGGRLVVNLGEKMLKVSEETDEKKRKLKELGVGVGIAGIGTLIALKAPSQFSSVGAGMATAGFVSAMSPFGTEDKGFIPVLHGTAGLSALDEFDEANELNSPTEEELELDEALNEADYLQEKTALNGDLDENYTIDVDHEEMGSELN